jgi:hypothetical protein
MSLIRPSPRPVAPSRLVSSVMKPLMTLRDGPPLGGAGSGVLVAGAGVLVAGAAGLLAGTGVLATAAGVLVAAAGASADGSLPSTGGRAGKRGPAGGWPAGAWGGWPAGAWVGSGEGTPWAQADVGQSEHTASESARKSRSAVGMSGPKPGEAANVAGLVWLEATRLTDSGDFMAPPAGSTIWHRGSRAGLAFAGQGRSVADPLVKMPARVETDPARAVFAPA